jgi:hypothetical protein
LIAELAGATPTCDLPFDGPDRRKTTRMAVAVAVRLQPMDERLAAVGESFTAITRDISSAGVGLVSTRPVKAPFLLLQFPTAESAEARLVQWVVRVERCAPLGEFHDLGTSFIAPVPDTL